MRDGGKRRTFGVKQQARGTGKSPAARSFGVKHPVPRGSGRMESCPENCPGEYVGGFWIHSRDCQWASVLWKHHGFTVKDWACPFDCDPIEMSAAWTHPYDCVFWDRTGYTPFDQLKAKP